MQPVKRALTGRVAVVTGSTRGLGFAMARLLGRHGATVVLSSRSEADVTASVDELRKRKLDAHGLAADVGDWGDVEALRDFAASIGPLDIWVNNAGASGVFGPTATTPVEDFDRVIRTNIMGTFHGSRAALGVFVPRGHGDLVNVYGRGDKGPVPLQNAYASSKGWVRQFTETLQDEVKGSGARVHGFNPGLVKTDMLGRVTVQQGYERRVQALPGVVALWGQTPDAAARPLLELVTTGRPEYRDLDRGTMLKRGLTRTLTGRARKRKPLDITSV